MALTTNEVCDLLNNYAKDVCPELLLDFQPRGFQQPTVVVSFFSLTDSSAFTITEIAETKGKDLDKLFKHRVNDALVRIAKKVLNSTIE